MRFTQKAEASSTGSTSDPERIYPWAASNVNDHHAIYKDDLELPPLEHTTEKKLITRIDLRLMITLCILYFLAFLDRVNIANAAVFNLTEDLDMTDGNKLNTALVIFFVPYVIFEVPSNILMKRLRPHVWLTGCMFMFGLVSTCQGLVSNYGGLLTTRFFLGLFETGMFPGCFYLIGMWYKRSEAQRRYTFFFASTTLAGAFGGLLASAIGKMDGLRGYSAWRWIFILEGVLTCVVAIILFFLITDFPEDAKWLSESERDYVKARLQAEQGRNALERKITVQDIINVFKDFKIVVGGFMYLGLIVPAYGYAYFAPTIIQGYGYSPIQTQLHSVPPWAAAWAFSMLVAYSSDKTRHRFGFAIFAILVAIAGFGVLLGVHNDTRTQYAALFLVTMGASVGSAYQIGFGNIGGIIAVYAFLEKDAPEYTPGYSICIAFCVLSMLSCVIYGSACLWQNRRREKMPRMVEGYEEDEEERKMGDMRQGYRYLL
ncbi:MAG: hypothetical protein M1831_003283 [Alyxoria varia]|nr:MAG: hypothetical protein M1831_003283 [Alyxoria varia]